MRCKRSSNRHGSVAAWSAAVVAVMLGSVLRSDAAVSSWSSAVSSTARPLHDDDLQPLPSFLLLSSVRGGADKRRRSFFNSNRAEQQHVAQLEETLLQKDRHLRALRDQTNQLRHLLRAQSQSDRMASSEALRHATLHAKEMEDERNLLKDELRELKNLIEEEYEPLLQEARLRTQTLQTELQQEREQVVQLQTRAALQREDAQSALSRLSTRHDLELQQTLELQRAKLLDEFEQQLTHERIVGEEALEKERVKMRKLVKALALREQQQQQHTNTNSNTTEKRSKKNKNATMVGTTGSSGSSSSRSSTTTTPEKAHVVKGGISTNSNSGGNKL